MAYTFDQVFAVDEANTSNVAQNASVLIFAPGDTAKTPLTITTTDGQPLANPIVVNSNGFGPAFMHATLDRVAWEGGGFTGFFTSYDGIKEEAVAARSAADTAASNAANSATAAEASANLVGAPADTAVQTIVSNPASATRVQLDGTYAMSSTFKRIVAGGANTTGDNIRVGNFAYGPTDVGTTYVQGGATNYENVIGGNTANVNTATSNLTGAAALVAPNGNWSAIMHGYDNVNNGWANVITGFHCYAVAGSNHGTIAGGSDQKITGTDVSYATIGGGTANQITATGGTIAGGYSHTVSGTQGTVGGGLTNVASGALSTVAGGQTNTASGSNAVVAGGKGNAASGAQASIGGGLNNIANNLTATVAGGSGASASNQYASVGGGLTTVASGVGATVPGGRENTALGNYSVATGRGASTTLEGQKSHASGFFTAQGDAQVSEYVARNTSTDGTAKELFLQGTGTRMAIPDDTTWFFTVDVVARRTDADGESAAYRYTGCVDRGVGAATTALVGTITETVVAEDNPAWGVALTVGTSDGTLRVTATGEAAKTIRWVAYIRAVQVTG